VTITALYDLINVKTRNNVNSFPDAGICSKKGKKERKKNKKQKQTEKKKQQRTKLANK